MRPHEPIGLKEKGLITTEELWKSCWARIWRNNRTTIAGREVYRSPQGHYSHEEKFHMNIPHRQPGSSRAVFKCFETVKKDTLLLWWTAREIAITVLTLSLLGTMLRFFVILFFITRLKQLGIHTRFTLQLSNTFYVFSQYLAEVWEMMRENTQRKNDVSVESENQQSDCVEG